MAKLPPPSYTPTQSRGLRVDLRRAIIPTSLGVLVVLRFAFGAPLILLIPLSLIVPLGYFLATLYVRKHWPPFEQQFNRLLMVGDVDALWAHYDKARLLRALSPPYAVMLRRGLLFSLRGEHRMANASLDEAWELSPPRERSALLGPMTRAKYETGDIDGVRVLAEQWRQRAVFPGPASVYLAAACLADPREDAARVDELLDEAMPHLGGADLALAEDIRARAAARQG